MRMDVLVLERSGPLTGTVDAAGAKNAALPVMATCLLTDEESVIEGVPNVTDVVTMTKILRTLGAEVAHEGGCLVIRPGRYNGWTAPYELVSVMRASVCV